MAIFPAEWHFDGVESGFCRQNVVSTASNQHSADKMAIRRRRIGVFLRKWRFDGRGNDVLPTKR